MSSLKWKFNRLRLMGLPEILYRVQQVARKKAAQRGIGLVPVPPAANLDRFGVGFLHLAAPGAEPEGLREAADRILAGRWRVFAMDDAHLGFPPQWNRDPKTGTVSPSALGKGINYRDERIVGDIKYLWEPSRHLELATLALAWNATQDPKYAQGCRTLLTSWLDQCPYPLGPHWASSLELAVRLVNWSAAWQLLGGAQSSLFQGEEGQHLLKRWLDSVYQHCHFIDGYYSRHSSANNHLFGEYMGLFIGSLTWPCWKESAGWQAKAKAGLEAEALIQNAPDGVNREQAVYYHHEVMDMMLICHLAGAANGKTFSAAYLERLERMAGFLHALMDAGGNVPMFGDADDALMIRLSHQPGWCHNRSLLASCAILFNRPDLKYAAAAFDDKNRWLFGEEGRQRWDSLQAERRQPVLQFPDGGYYLLGRDWGLASEIKAVVDCAPLGFLSIAAHGHADSLSMVLSAAGEELLVDPGTYAYHTQKKWRDYFRSTAAHNTVCVDGVDQSVIGGNFMWLDKANSVLVRYAADEAGQVFEGEHDGYRRLSDPVVHRRRIEFDATRAVFVVTDTVECKGEHRVQIFWHAGEQCSVVIRDGVVSVASATGKASADIAAPGLQPTLLSGDEQLPAGWISRTFDHKQPTASICYAAEVRGTTQFRTEIAVRVQAAASPEAGPASDRKEELIA